MIKVVNKYGDKHTYYKGRVLYCGRGSVLGNPFVMQNQSIEERNRVCGEFEKYFFEKIEQKNKNFIEALNFIFKESKSKDVNLGCFCAPKRCHCDTIKNFVDKMNKEIKL